MQSDWFSYSGWSIHIYSLMDSSIFLKPFAGAATQWGYPADIAASAHPVRPGTTSGDGSAAAQVQDADAGKSAGALNWAKRKASSLGLGSLAFLSNFHIAKVWLLNTVEESSIEPLQWALDLPRTAPCQIPLSPVERRPRSNALLCFQLTGGTTGSSKCVEVTQQMALHELAAYPKTFPELSHEVREVAWSL